MIDYIYIESNHYLIMLVIHIKAEIDGVGLNYSNILKKVNQLDIY